LNPAGFASQKDLHRFDHRSLFFHSLYSLDSQNLALFLVLKPDSEADEDNRDQKGVSLQAEDPVMHVHGHSRRA
jgi:hypothetical protein